MHDIILIYIYIYILIWVGIHWVWPVWVEACFSTFLDYKILYNQQLHLCSAKSISNRLGKFLNCLENEQWLLPFSYPLFKIHFSTDSLSHLNIIYSFIIYSFFNNYTSSNIFFIQYLIIIIEKKYLKNEQ